MNKDMNKDFADELRNVWDCLNEQSLCVAFSRMTFGATADANFTNLTSRRAAQGLALSRGG